MSFRGVSRKLMKSQINLFNKKNKHFHIMYKETTVETDNTASLVNASVRSANLCDLDATEVQINDQRQVNDVS